MPDPRVLAAVSANLQRVRDDISDAASGWPVTLVCITKYARAEWADALLKAGATDLGENLLPDAAERFRSFEREFGPFTRHLIGPLQSKKTGMVPGNFDMFQAMDRLKIAGLLNRELERQNQTLDVLVQINIAGEQSKSGFTPDEAEESAHEIRERLHHLNVRGLMAIPPGPQAYTGARDYEQGTRTHFRHMYKLFDKIRSEDPASAGFNVLSMGMSHDYRWAIEEGANMVRVGSALFKGLEG